MIAEKIFWRNGKWIKIKVQIISEKGVFDIWINDEKLHDMSIINKLGLKECKIK